MPDQRPDVDALRALTGAATPGPWWTPAPGWPSIVSEHVNICGMHDGGRSDGLHPPEPDAALIVAARNALPDLLGHVSRLEAVAEAARAIDPEKLRSIAQMLDFMDTLMSKIKVGDEPGENYFRELKGKQMQDDLRSWAAALDTSVVVPDADGGQS